MKKVLMLAAFAIAAEPSMAQGSKQQEPTSSLDWPSRAEQRQSQVQYTVSGTFAKNGKTVYLIDELTEQKIDSTVVADGRFSFTGTAAQDALMAVRAKSSSWTTQFFNDGTPVSINLNDSTLKGSPQNERLTKINYEMEQPRKRFAAMTANLTEADIEARADELSDEMNKMITELTTRANRAFNEEHNSLIPVAFAGYYFLENGVEAYDELVKQQVAFAGHPYLKKIRDEVAEETRPKDGEKMAFIGQQYTDLEMADPNGKMHKISELMAEGKYVLVDFWASWCGPCRAEMPNVLEAYNKFHDKGFEVVGVSFDQKKEAWVKAIGQLKMPWLQISDLKGWNCAAAPIYKIDGIPDNILIDPQGKIIYRGLRGKALHTRLEQVLKK